MVQLIFLRSKGTLRDGRTVVEGQQFEVDQDEADAFIRGGTIVRLVTPEDPVKEQKYGPVQTEDPIPETPEVIPPPEDADKIFLKSMKKRKDRG